MRPSRIATVCVSGRVAERHGTTPTRLNMMNRIVDLIADRSDWANLDAVVFPGGFFRAVRPIGDLSYRERVKELDREGLVKPTTKLAKLLRNSPGVLIVAGIDGPGDQSCVAWDVNGIAGIGRKIFPVGSEKEGDWLTCQETDYATEHRVVTLQSG